MTSSSSFCSFGCGKPAIRQFKNGKWCCSNHANQCPVRRFELSQTRQQYDNIQRYSRWHQTYYSVGTDGISSAVKVGRLNSHLIPKGSEKAVKRGQKVKASRLANNIDSYFDGANKGVLTKVATILPDGRTAFEANMAKVHRPNRRWHSDANLYVDSKPETQFVEARLALNKKIRRGPTIHYVFNGVKKPYLVDFIIDDILYEVKTRSSWLKWRNIPQEEKNIAKLDAAVSEGYQIRLVIDNIEHNWNLNRDSIIMNLRIGFAQKWKRP